MAIGYRAILSADNNDKNVAATIEVLRKWVTRKKGFDALASRGEAVANATGGTLVANEIRERGRGVSGYRWVKLSEGETVRTNAKMVAQRTLSGLPESIDASGSKLRVAHIALATGRAGSPRLYFEDTVAAAGFVTVGYIGAHLDNTPTN